MPAINSVDIISKWLCRVSPVPGVVRRLGGVHGARAAAAGVAGGRRARRVRAGRAHRRARPRPARAGAAASRGEEVHAHRQPHAAYSRSVLRNILTSLQLSADK